MSVSVINYVMLFGEYLDYKNCKCRKRLIDKLLEECSENIDGNEMLYNETLDVISLNATVLNVYKKVCNSCTIYIILFADCIFHNKHMH